MSFDINKSIFVHSFKNSHHSLVEVWWKFGGNFGEASCWLRKFWRADQFSSCCLFSCCQLTSGLASGLLSSFPWPFLRPPLHFPGPFCFPFWPCSRPPLPFPGPCSFPFLPFLPFLPLLWPFFKPLLPWPFSRPPLLLLESLELLELELLLLLGLLLLLLLLLLELLIIDLALSQASSPQKI